MDTTSYFDRIAERGAIFFDEHYPDWVGRADPEALDMGHLERDICKQVTDLDFYDFVKKHGIGVNGFIELGLNVSPGVRSSDCPAQYRNLTRAWRIQIEKRRSLANAA